METVPQGGGHTPVKPFLNQEARGERNIILTAKV